MGNESSRRLSHEGEDAAGVQVHLEGIPVRVVRVHFDGVSRTKADILAANVKPVFGAKLYRDLINQALFAKARLQGLNCFSHVRIQVDTCKDGGKEDYEVTFQVQELGRVNGLIGTQVGNQEGSLVTEGKLQNILGRGEGFRVEYNYGTSRSSQINVSLSRPVHSLLNYNRVDLPFVSGSLFKSMYQSVPSGFKEVQRGCLLDFSFHSLPQVTHNLQWEGIWRELSCLNRNTSFAVRCQSGPSLKSALRHIISVDTRDGAIFPNRGSLIRLSTELAGLGGDIGFFKNELELQTNVPLVSRLHMKDICDVVLQASLKVGAMKPSADGKQISVSDNFFLGGPLNVRGYDTRGLGPSSEDNAIGGRLFWASGLHLYTTLPVRRSLATISDLFRTHLFITAGHLLGDNEMSQVNWTQLTKGMRLSCGLGLALRLGDMARVEANYCLPIMAKSGDKLAPGFQFGVGVSYL